MKDGLHITSPIPPSVNHYTATRAIMRGNKPFSVVYKTKESVAYQKAFKKEVAKAVEEQGWQTDLENPRHFYVDAVFYMDKKHKDCNNLWKCMLDAITETQLIWKDDDIVCERVNRIVYDAENPRVELYIHYVDYIGIFDSEKQLEDFRFSNCIDCSRYGRNCTILRGAIEGRLQPDIKRGVCKRKTEISNSGRKTTKKMEHEDLLGV